MSPGRPVRQIGLSYRPARLGILFQGSLKVPSGQIRSAWECYHWIGIEKDINRNMFLIFEFQFWILKTTSKFWAAPCKKASNPPACSVHGLHLLKPLSFSPSCVQKMRGRYQLFFGLRLVSKAFHHSAIQTKIELHFGIFFHQMKVRQPIGRQTVIGTSRRLESFLHEAAQNFELLSNIQDQK
jgi:hypothetical protein